MPTWSIAIPDEAQPRVIEALCATGRYQQQIPDEESGEMIPNPVNPTQFAKQRVKDFIRSELRAYEGQKAADDALAAKHTEIDGLGL